MIGLDARDQDQAAGLATWIIVQAYSQQACIELEPSIAPRGYTVYLEAAMEISRRDWFLASMVAWQEIAHAQKTGPAAFRYLDQHSAAEIEALVAQIVPTDDTPGAREAGVIYFIDHALTSFDQDKQQAYRQGMQEMQAKRQAMFPGSESIAALTSQQQIELLQATDRSEFFQLLRFHTLAGFLGNPSYGGNRDGIGWKLIGFDHKMAYQPPFGYYDAELKNG